MTDTVNWAGRTLGQLSADERRQVVQEAADKLQAELTANADAIGAILSDDTVTADESHGDDAKPKVPTGWGKDLPGVTFLNDDTVPANFGQLLTTFAREVVTDPDDDEDALFQFLCAAVTHYSDVIRSSTGCTLDAIRENVSP